MEVNYTALLITIAIFAGLFLLKKYAIYSGKKDADKILVTTGEVEHTVDLCNSIIEQCELRITLLNELLASDTDEDLKQDALSQIERNKKLILEAKEDIAEWEPLIAKYKGKYEVDVCERPVKKKT